MPFLLFPSDEKRLVAFLVHELGLKLLKSDLAQRGEPELVENPTDLRLPDVTTQPTEFLFWADTIGPIRTDYAGFGVRKLE